MGKYLKKYEVDRELNFVFITGGHAHFLCKGGSGDTVDREYNARVATVMEEAQELSNKYFAHWENTTKPIEEAQSKIKLGQVETEGDISTGVLNIQKDNLGSASDVISNFLKESNSGINANDYANRAGNDVKQAAQQSSDALTRNASRLGLNINSGSFVNAMKDSNITNAATEAAARTQAYRNAEDVNYQRKQAGATAAAGLYANYLGASS